jgi:hypothetical protein
MILIQSETFVVVKIAMSVTKSFMGHAVAQMNLDVQNPL